MLPSDCEIGKKKIKNSSVAVKEFYGSHIAVTFELLKNISGFHFGYVQEIYQIFSRSSERQIYFNDSMFAQYFNTFLLKTTDMNAPSWLMKS
jgi:hypothetical protein